MSKLKIKVEAWKELEDLASNIAGWIPLSARENFEEGFEKGFEAGASEERKRILEFLQKKDHLYAKFAIEQELGELDEHLY